MTLTGYAGLLNQTQPVQVSQPVKPVQTVQEVYDRGTDGFLYLFAPVSFVINYLLSLSVKLTAEPGQAAVQLGLNRLTEDGPFLRQFWAVHFIRD